MLPPSTLAYTFVQSSDEVIEDQAWGDDFEIVMEVPESTDFQIVPPRAAAKNFLPSCDEVNDQGAGPGPP
tara:strand:+ start:250 stop:459 length:210 start_codon:yes stop_codon:yes gene_type:complete